MELNILYAVIIWLVSIMADLCLVRILDENKLSFSDIVNRELPILIIMCVLAPIAFIILLLGAFSKVGIKIANTIPLEGNQTAKKDCSKCTHRCNNECLFFKLTLRPKMLCKGRFFSDLQAYNQQQI